MPRAAYPPPSPPWWRARPSRVTSRSATAGNDSCWRIMARGFPRAPPARAGTRAWSWTAPPNAPTAGSSKNRQRPPPASRPSAPCAALDRVHGLVLTGGEDVSPARYGARPHPKLGETDGARDAVELGLIAAARARRLPILAICRDIQILNVALGGTLYQDLSSERRGAIGHADTRSRHAVRVEPGSLLHRTLATLEASVNSRHHQAIRDLAPSLVATAWAPDGVIEAAEPRAGEPWTLAGPGHPEDDVEGALFRGFAEAVRLPEGVV